MPYWGNPNDGNMVQITAEGLLEYFRTHINDFIPPTINVSFEPYTHYIAGSVNINEATAWNMTYENSLGALVHIDMLDDGTVVESGYYQGYGSNHFNFTFTTMKTPLDYSHPVAGNRRFGVFQSGGSYYFYISGVDRTNDFSTTIANWNFLGTQAFSGADQLWQSVQAGMIAFVEDHYGLAADAQQKIIRPKWNIIKQFLEKQITLEEMKTLLHCP